jgi:hypothetical protein
MSADDLLTDTTDDLLHRQVHPTNMDDGAPSYLAFLPTTKDEGLLSTSRDSVLNAEAAYRHHTGSLGLASAGSWSVSLEEVANLAADDATPPIHLPAIDDGDDAHPGHVSLDFRGLATKPLRHAAAKGLRLAATSRGRSFP